MLLLAFNFCWVANAQTVPSCGEKFYDTGGPDGDFENNESYTVTIVPDNPGDLVTATFVL